MCLDFYSIENDTSIQYITISIDLFGWIEFYSVNLDTSYLHLYLGIVLNVDVNVYKFPALRVWLNQGDYNFRNDSALKLFSRTDPERSRRISRVLFSAACGDKKIIFLLIPRPLAAGSFIWLK